MHSDPLEEQNFVATLINFLERQPTWKDTAVVILYDDSDGWYDHQFSGIHNPSLSPADNLTNTTFSPPTSGQCGAESTPHSTPLAGEQGRCGFGPRQPLLLISPFARPNFVDHSLSSAASIINLVEYNWRLPSISGSADQLLSERHRFESRERPFDLADMFNFKHSDGNGELILNPKTGHRLR